MIQKIIKKMIFFITQKKSLPTGESLKSDKTDTKFINQSEEAQLALRQFIVKAESEPLFISLGENCSSAWYLKQAGLKKASYPFDWVFSSPDIILDCINDKFVKFLDQKLMIAKKSKKSAGHQYYHTNLFNHRSPLKSKKDYSYYERCCKRFIDHIESNSPVCFVITLINEPTKRPGWANGFVNRFKMPVDQNHLTISPLVEKLQSLNDNCQFIIIDHYTNRERSATAHKVSPNMMWITYNAAGNSTGVFYEDPLDDSCYKVIMKGLHGLSKAETEQAS